MKQAIHAIRVVVVLAGLCLVAGCGGASSTDAQETGASQRQATAGDVALTTRVLDGTIGQLAYLEGGGTRVVRGYGLVVGLAGTGSSQCPTAVRRALVEDMGRLGIGDNRTGTGALTPNRLIDDPDTAVVVVSALIPPGTPAGTVLDAAVSALPNSQTLSLDGGTLYLTQLRAFSTDTGAVRESRVLAATEGEVFVNPFAENRDPTSTSRLRRGRIIGGCKSAVSREIRLVLRQPDHAMARILQQTINDRFEGYPKVANAQDPSYIEIRVPQRYRDDYDRFLRLLMHLYIRRGGGIEDRKANRLVEDIVAPGAPTESISLIWEGMGREVLPIIRRLYPSENLEAAFGAARAGARLGDDQGVTVLSAVATGESVHRMEAIAELGQVGSVAAAETLRDLLSDPDATVRVAAYEAISAGRLGCGIKRHDVNGRFSLDVVPSTGEYVVYVTRSGRPRIALFGDGMRVRQPIFFTTPNDLVTINSTKADADLQVYRRVGARKRLSEAISVPPDLRSVVLALGGSAVKNESGGFQGLELTYSQVVGVLHRLCEGDVAKKVPAVFVLQRPDATDRITPGPMPPGRQDSSSRQ